MALLAAPCPATYTHAHAVGRGCIPRTATSSCRPRSCATVATPAGAQGVGRLTATVGRSSCTGRIAGCHPRHHRRHGQPLRGRSHPWHQRQQLPLPLAAWPPQPQECSTASAAAVMRPLLRRRQCHRLSARLPQLPHGRRQRQQGQNTSLLTAAGAPCRPPSTVCAAGAAAPPRPLA